MKRTPIARRTPLRRTALHEVTVKPQPAKPRRDTGPTVVVRRLVAARSQGWCEFNACPNRAEQVHHRRPRAMGGSRQPETNQPTNLIHFCRAHHDWTESNRAEALVFGLLVHAWQTPAEVPVWLRHSPRPVLLDNSGGWTVADLDLVA